jgi:hypothetical protein
MKWVYPIMICICVAIAGGIVYTHYKDLLDACGSRARHHTDTMSLDQIVDELRLAESFDEPVMERPPLSGFYGGTTDVDAHLDGLSVLESKLAMAREIMALKALHPSNGPEIVPHPLTQLPRSYEPQDDSHLSVFERSDYNADGRSVFSRRGERQHRGKVTTRISN